MNLLKDEAIKNIYLPFNINVDSWPKDSMYLFLDKYYALQLGYLSKNNNRYQIIPDNVISINKNDLRKFESSIIYFFSTYLNTIHKVDFSYNFWEKMFAGWLEPFLVNITCKIQELDYISKNYNNIYSYIFHSSINEKFLKDCPLPFDIAEYNEFQYEYLVKNFFNIKTYKRSRTKKLKTNPTVSCSQQLKECFIEKLLKKTLNGELIQSVINRITTFQNIRQNNKILKTCKVLLFDSFIPQDSIDSFNKKSSYKISTTNPEIILNHNIDYKLRNKIKNDLKSFFNTIGYQYEYEKIIILLIADFIPCFFLEYFADYLEYSKKFLSQWKNLKTIYHVCIYNKNVKSFLCIYAQTKGIRILTSQHGGNYAWEIDNCKDEAIIADDFYGWGTWTSNINNLPAKFHNCDTYRLHSLYGESDIPNGNYILYVGSYIEPYKCRLNQINNTKNNITYIEKQISFFKLIDRTMLKNILVRNCWRDFGYNINQILVNNIPDINIQDNTQNYAYQQFDYIKRNSSFSDTLKKASLCIYDDIETPFFEALYINKPVILLLNKNNLKFRNEEYPIIKIMESAGIIQYDEKKLSILINQFLFDNSKILEWWNSKQEVIHILRKHFVNKVENIDNTVYKELLKYV